MSLIYEDDPGLPPLHPRPDLALVEMPRSGYVQFSGVDFPADFGSGSGSSRV